MSLSRLPLVAVLAVVAVALLAPAAPAVPTSSPAAGHVTKKVKACKRKKGETKKHWLKRCKCAKFKRGESRRNFKKRCPGAKVPRRNTPSTGGGTTTPAPALGPVPGPASPAPLQTVPTPPGQSDVDKVTRALTGTQLGYFSSSSTSGASEDERYRFCSGSFQYTHRRVEISGLAYDSHGAGSWQITQAVVYPDGVSGAARLHYVLASYESNDPDGTPPNQGDIELTFNGSKVNLGGRTYDVTRIQC